MTEIQSERSRIAVGIIVNAETLPLLHQTVISAKTLSEHIFILAEKQCSVSEENVTVNYGGWADDEAATKNMLIDFVEDAEVADWLLWMNPGEEFDEKTLDEFQYFIEHDAHRDFIYMMVLYRLFREDHIRHDFDEETIDTRLMPLRKGVRFQGRVRASILTRSVRLMIQIGAAPGRFLLPTAKFDPGKSSKRAKQVLDILEKMENEGEILQDDLLAAQAESQFLLGNFVDSRKSALQLIKMSQRSDLRLSAYYLLWETFVKAPIPDVEITKYMIEAVDHFPVDMQLLTFLGSHMQRTGKLDLAIRTFETAIQHGRVSLDVWHRLRIREIALTSLALCFRLQDKNGKAVQVLETYAELVEDRSEFNRHLLDLYIADNQEAKAAELAAEIWGAEELDSIRIVIKGACLAKLGHWDTALIPLHEAYEQGLRDVFCLRWYSLALLAVKQFQSAIKVLEQWLEVQPENSEAKSYYAAAQHPDRFGDTMRRIRDAHLRSLGMMTNKPMQRRPHVTVEDAVREMFQASGASGKISGFTPKPAKEITR